MQFVNNIFFKKVKDYSVSKEIFELHHNPEYDILITYPKPTLDRLSLYYESEDYISHTDGKRSLFEKVYQFVKTISLKRKIKLLNSTSNKGKLLDVGAGTGEFLRFAFKDGWEVKGIEPNEKAKQRALDKGISFENTLSDIADNTYDVITMWHVLEHIPDLNECINDLNRIIKPNGTIIIAVPNFKSFDAEFYGKFWAAYDVPRHLWHFSETSIDRLFSEKNIRLEKILPMKFDSFYVSLLSEKYKTGRMNFIRAFFVGLKSNMNGKKTKQYSSHIYVLKS